MLPCNCTTIAVIILRIADIKIFVFPSPISCFRNQYVTKVYSTTIQIVTRLYWCIIHSNSYMNKCLDKLKRGTQHDLPRNKIVLLVHYNNKTIQWCTLSLLLNDIIKTQNTPPINYPSSYMGPYPTVMLFNRQRCYTIDKNVIPSQSNQGFHVTCAYFPCNNARKDSNRCE